MSRKRWIVRVKNLFGLNEEQRKWIQTMLKDWYENGPDPLVIGEDCEVYGFTDEWEHMVDVAPRKQMVLAAALAENAAKGWQLCGMTDSEYGGLLLVFKRPKPLEGSEDE